MKVQTYLDRVLSGATEAEFVAEFPHSVLVELEGQEDDHGSAAAMTERLDSHAIKLMSKSSRDANVFVIEFAHPEGTVKVGRASDADVLVDHKSVSKGHAEFTLGEGPKLVLKDLGSTNGTFVNNRKLPENTPTSVFPDDTLRFGRATGYYLMDAKGFFQYLVTLQRFGL